MKPKNIAKELNEHQLHMLMRIEQKVTEFREQDLVQAQNNFQQVEAQRQQLIAQINHIQGAINGGMTIIRAELAEAGVAPETYERQKQKAKASMEQEEGPEPNTKSDNLVTFPAPAEAEEEIITEG